jgi:Flp pilus assembly pilin Flp
MKNLIEPIAVFHRDEQGTSSTEYTILLVALALGVLAAAAYLGQGLVETFVGGGS